jgi:hypothetical protein
MCYRNREQFAERLRRPGADPGRLCWRFEGLVGAVSLDEYGDVVRSNFMFKIQDGQFVTLAAPEPE